MCNARYLGIIAGGSVALTAGTASGQFDEPDVTVIAALTGKQAGESYGWGVAHMADIDNDGKQDAIIGAPFGSANGAFSGRIEVVSGADGSLIHEIIGPAGSAYGWSVADAGDTNNDGVNDIVVGAPGGAAGHLFVVSGADGSTLLTIMGPAGGGLGTAVAGAGDINGDGHDDVLGGDAFAPGPDGLFGTAFVYSGFDGSVLRQYDGEGVGVFFGFSTALTGDLNGDAFPDHIIGAPNSGHAFVFSGADGTRLLPILSAPKTSGQFGQFFAAGLDDVDGDGTPDLYVGDFADRGNSGAHFAPGSAYVYSGATGENIHRFRGTGQTTGVGPGRGAGDVDGDGHDDLAVGAFSASNSIAGGGRLLIFSGRTGGLLREITGNIQSAQVGFDAVGLGDVNDDGAPDLLLSAANGDSVYIIAGHPFTCEGDLDRNDVIDDRDLKLLTEAIGDDYEPGDLDGDGDVDSDDITLLLAMFGPCN